MAVLELGGDSIMNRGESELEYLREENRKLRENNEKLTAIAEQMRKTLDRLIQRYITDGR